MRIDDEFYLFIFASTLLSTLSVDGAVCVCVCARVWKWRRKSMYEKVIQSILYATNIFRQNGCVTCVYAFPSSMPF